jgi:hypothetical protein
LLKKIAIILLLCVYSVSSIGATIHLHYCMGKFVNWSVTHIENDVCEKCGMKEDADKKGCCKDEHKEIKIKSEHQKAGLQAEVVKPFFTSVIEKPFLVFLLSNSYSNKNKTTFFYPPPIVASTKRHILFGTFLI